MTPKGTIDFKELFLNNWVQSPSGGSNVFGADFALFSSFVDAQKDENRWKFCDFDQYKVGFPRNCGRNGAGKFIYTLFVFQEKQTFVLSFLYKCPTNGILYSIRSLQKMIMPFIYILAHR